MKRTGDGRIPGASPSKQAKQVLHWKCIDVFFTCNLTFRYGQTGLCWNLMYQIDKWCRDFVTAIVLWGFFYMPPFLSKRLTNKCKKNCVLSLSKKLLFSMVEGDKTFIIFRLLVWHLVYKQYYWGIKVLTATPMPDAWTEMHNSSKS